MHLSEKNLVDNFIQNHPNKTNLIVECDFRWGNIDVVEYESYSEVYLNVDQVKILRNNKNLNVFSCLYRNRGLRVETISLKSGLDINVVKLILRKLILNNIVVINGYTYSINSKINFPDIKVYAYEMKLIDIRKAINQAVINQSFCDYSYIVFPQSKSKLCQKYFNLLTDNGVGLILVNDDENNIIIRAKKGNTHKSSILSSKIKLIESRICI